jgi:chromosome segregation ATPase
MAPEGLRPLGWVSDALEEREAAAARFQRLAADREVDLERLVAEQEASLADLRERLGERDAQIEAAREQISAMEREIAWLREVLADRERELSSIRSSFLWRSTSWLRRR